MSDSQKYLNTVQWAVCVCPLGYSTVFQLYQHWIKQQHSFHLLNQQWSWIGRRCVQVRQNTACLQHKPETKQHDYQGFRKNNSICIFVTTVNPLWETNEIKTSFFKSVCTTSSMTQTWLSALELPHSTAQLFTIKLGKQIHKLKLKLN